MNIVAIVLAAALSAGNAEFDATAREGARRISISRAAAELREKGPSRGALEKAMLADPAKFEKPEDAERLCRDLFAAELRAQFAAKAREIDERLGIAERGEAMPADDVASAVERHFRGTFAAERKSAVEAQAKTLVAATRPSEADFDSKDDDALRRQMADSIVGEQKTAVFAENRQFISERMVEPVVKDARREQRRQSEYLMRARCDAAAPSKLAAGLRARLEENVKERRAKAEDPSKAWGLFAGTFERSVGPAVERRTLDRLEKKVESSSVVVDADAILKEIVESAEEHVRASDSERIFAGRYAAGILACALDGACGDAPEDERGELRAYLSERLGSAAVRKAAEAKVRKDVLPKWRDARAKAAARQADETWPTLVDGTWCPDAELADDVAARSDYAKSVREWRSMAALKALADAPGGRPLMEEADRRADAGIAAAFDIARGAIAAQNAIVDSSHALVLAEARRRKDSLWTRTPDLKSVVELLTKATEDEWDATRLATLWPDETSRPPNAEEQHRALFPSVRRKIELVAKSILEEMNDSKPENEEKPEEPPPEETPDSPEEEPLVEFTISVSQEGNTISVKLLRGEETVLERKVDARMSDFSDGMMKVSDKLGRDILKLR